MPDDTALIETLFGPLRYERRRRILAYFYESDREAVHLDELVEHLENRPDETRHPDRLAVELHHRSLPSLDEIGLVEYETEARTIRCTENPKVRTVLGFLDDLGDEASGSC